LAAGGSGASSGDPYIWLEDLDSPETRRFIEEMNGELRRLLGSLPERLYPRLLQLLREPRVTSLAAVGDSVAALVKAERDRVTLLSRRGGEKLLAEAGPGEIIHWLQSVKGARAVLVSKTVGGRDEGVAYIIDADGRLVHKTEGSIADPCMAGGRLYYVRFYRTTRSPDGAEPPVTRVVAAEPGGEGERLAWGPGAAGTGEMIDLYCSPRHGWSIAVVRRGWSSARLYGGPSPEEMEPLSLPVEAGYSVAGPVEGMVAVHARKSGGGGELLLLDPGSWSVEERIPLPRPAEHVAADGSTVAAVTVQDARHVVTLYRPGGGEWSTGLGEPSTVEAIEALEGGGYAVLATSFTRPHRVLELREGSVEPILEAPRFEAWLGEFWVPSRDGTRIHAWHMAPREGRPRGVVVYGYGGFNISLTPRYNPAARLLVELGYAWVVANTRGGGEEGEEWHRAGMLRNKHKVFEDFEAVVEHVKKLGARVAAWGASNGGLLVAAVETRRPDLLDAAVIGYPVLDMLRFHLLYIGKLWVHEYGDPEDPEMRRYLESYSPYHNIPPAGEARLPPTLVYTGLGDDRVHPGHALKYVAKARDLGHRSVYLRVETESGHSGATAETKARELADIIAFIVKALGEG